MLSEVRKKREQCSETGQTESALHWAGVAARHSDSDELDCLRMAELCRVKAAHKRALFWLGQKDLIPDGSSDGIRDARWMAHHNYTHSDECDDHCLSTLHLRALVLASECLFNCADLDSLLLLLGSDDHSVWSVLHSDPNIKDDKENDHRSLISSLCLWRGRGLERAGSTGRALWWYQRALECDACNVAALHRMVDRRLLSHKTARDLRRKMRAMVMADSISECVRREWVECLDTIIGEEKGEEEVEYYSGMIDMSGDNPNHNRASVWKARKLAEQCRFSEALKIAEKTVSNDPCNLSGNGSAEWLAALYGLNKQDELKAAVQQVSSVDERSPVKWLALGLSQLTRNESDNARRSLSKATKMEDCPPLAWLAYADSLSKEGASEAALRALRTASRVFDGSHEWLVRMAKEYSAMEKWSIADALLSLCVRDLGVNKDARVWSELGVCAMSEHRMDEAEQCFNKALRLGRDGRRHDQSDWATLINLGHCLRLKGDVHSALLYYDRASQCSVSVSDTLTLNCMALCHALIAQSAASLSEVRSHIRSASALLHSSLAINSHSNGFAHSCLSKLIDHCTDQCFTLHSSY